MIAYLLTDGYASKIDIKSYEQGKEIRDKHREKYGVKTRLLIEIFADKEVHA